MRNFLLSIFFFFLIAITAGSELLTDKGVGKIELIVAITLFFFAILRIYMIFKKEYFNK